MDKEKLADLLGKIGIFLLMAGIVAGFATARYLANSSLYAAWSYENDYLGKFHLGVGIPIIVLAIICFIAAKEISDGAFDKTRKPEETATDITHMARISFCPYCGCKLDEGDVFCGKCGKLISVD